MITQKVKEVRTFSKRYFSRLKGAEYTATITAEYTQNAEGRTIVTIYNEKPENITRIREDFNFIHSDPARAEAVANLIEYACQHALGEAPWEKDGKF